VPGSLAACLAVRRIGAVTAVSQNGIQLNITKQQVKDLPSGWHRSPG